MCVSSSVSMCVWRLFSGLPCALYSIYLNKGKPSINIKCHVYGFVNVYDWSIQTHTHLSRLNGSRLYGVADDNDVAKERSPLAE